MEGTHHLVTAQELEDLVIAWFEDARRPLEDEAFRWAHTQVQDYSLFEPDQAWPVILRLIESAPSDALLARVAAGPLESALASHPAYLLERAIGESRANPRLRQCFRFVQLDDDPEDGVPREVLDALEAAIPEFRRF